MISDGPMWRPVPGWEGVYEVSSWAAIRRCSTGKYLRGSIRLNRGRYRGVVLSRPGVQLSSSAHRIVALAFHGVPERPGLEVRHLDGDSLNNCADNLAWGTPSENRLDAVRHGTHQEVRKATCVNGHPFDEFNTYRRPSRPRHRECVTCRRTYPSRLPAAARKGLSRG